MHLFSVSASIESSFSGTKEVARSVKHLPQKYEGPQNPGKKLGVVRDYNLLYGELETGSFLTAQPNQICDFQAQSETSS